jgi:hypothetical protein
MTAHWPDAALNIAQVILPFLLLLTTKRPHRLDPNNHPFSFSFIQLVKFMNLAMSHSESWISIIVNKLPADQAGVSFLDAGALTQFFDQMHQAVLILAGNFQREVEVTGGPDGAPYLR